MSWHVKPLHLQHLLFCTNADSMFLFLAANNVAIKPSSVTLTSSDRKHWFEAASIFTKFVFQQQLELLVPSAVLASSMWGWHGNVPCSSTLAHLLWFFPILMMVSLGAGRTSIDMEAVDWLSKLPRRSTCLQLWFVQRQTAIYHQHDSPGCCGDVQCPQRA